MSLFLNNKNETLKDFSSFSAEFIKNQFNYKVKMCNTNYIIYIYHKNSFYLQIAHRNLVK